MHETEPAPNDDAVRVLLGLSAVLAIVMALTGGFLIWRSRGDASQPANGGGDTHAQSRDTGSSLPDRRNSAANGGEGVGGNAAFLWAPVPEFELTERSGRTVTNKDLLGRPWAVCFIFTHCAGPCPLVTGQMKMLQDRFEGRPVRLVTITVDPERDTPERLSQYADAFGADEEQWLFLTGRQEPIYRLIRDGFHMPVEEMQGEDRKPGFEILHTTNVIHVDAFGRIRRKYNARNDAEMAALIRALAEDLDGLPPKSGNAVPSDGAPADDAPPVSRDAESSERSAPSSSGTPPHSSNRPPAAGSPEPQGT